MFAVVNVHKPLHLTSHDVVARLRRIYGLKKVGHTGTLDPLAEGVLPVCLGQATRLIEYFPDDKRYRAQVTLGRITTTLDAEGEVLSETDCSGMDLSPNRLEAVLAPFRGDIQQQVPLYSAVHVKGKKLYELARQGKTAELPTRAATIHELTLREISGQGSSHPVLTLDVHCGSGTYIRSLARDIGDALGCGAYLSGLVRTAHGLFTLDAAVPLETLESAANPQQYLLKPLDFLSLPVIALAMEADYRMLSNGMNLPIERLEAVELPPLKPNRPLMVTYRGQPVCIAEYDRQRLKPAKVFAQNAILTS